MATREYLKAELRDELLFYVVATVTIYIDIYCVSKILVALLEAP